MTVTAFSKGGLYRGDLWGVAVLVIIGVTLIVLARQSSQASGYRQPLCRLALQERHARLIADE